MGIGQDIRTKCNDTYRLFREKAFSCPTLADQHARATNASSGEMRRVLGALDLIALGVGAIVGAGVFVLTGLAAREHAGPAVVLSYLFASLAAVLSAFAYAEYAVEMPFAGGAYNYVSLTFGEFAAWLVACNLMLEYTLSAATVARGFTGYVAALFDATTDDLTIGDPDSMFSIDFLAFGLILLESAILAYGTRQSASFNVGVTGANLAVIVFVIVLGFPNVKSSNYTPFLPFGWRGVFAGAAQVFFSFIGFDMITTAAEEVNMPLGVITSLGICAVLYALMCLVITGMVSYELIDEFAPFAEAFRVIGWDWASYVVSIGAITGILTSLLVGLLGQARVYVVLGRDRLLPPWIARVNERTATPINATVVTALSAGLLALLVNINLLAELVSAGTLFVFYMVSMGVLVRRYWDPSVPRMRLWLGVRLAALSLCAVLFSVTYINRAHWALPATFLGMCAIVTASFLWLPQVYHPKTFATPLLPFLPCASMVVDLHLIGSLGTGEHGSLAFVRLAGMFVLALVLYLAYSMHHSYGSAAPPPQASELGQRQNGLASHGDVQMAALPGSDVVAKLPDSSPDTRRVSNGVGGAKAPKVEEARVEGSGDSSSSVQLLFGESDSSTADAWNSSSGLPL